MNTVVSSPSFSELIRMAELNELECIRCVIIDVGRVHLCTFSPVSSTWAKVYTKFCFEISQKMLWTRGKPSLNYEFFVQFISPFFYFIHLFPFEVLAVWTGGELGRLCELPWWISRPRGRVHWNPIILRKWQIPHCLIIDKGNRNSLLGSCGACHCKWTQ